MHGYELLVPFLIADRERKAKEARLAHLAAQEPFEHQATDVEIPEAEIDNSWIPALRGWPYDASLVKRNDPDPSRARSASTQPVLGRFINRFTGRQKAA